MTYTFFILLIGFQLKHFIADYLLQPSWMVHGKGSMGAMGGYIHAGIHAMASALVLLVVQTPLVLILVLCAIEFVVHYFLDYAKIHYSHGVDERLEPARFWGLFGLDQLFHQLTYVVMIFFSLRAVTDVMS